MKTTLLGVALLGTAAIVLSACHTKPIENPAVPPLLSVTPTPTLPGEDYTQKLITGQYLKKRLAVARFVDNRPVEGSQFGHKRQVDVVGPGISVHQDEIVPESDEPSSTFTPKLINALARTKRFFLIERKDINSILREVSFDDTKWVDKDKSSRVGKILGAQIIVTGSISIDDEASMKPTAPLKLFLRMYDVESSKIVGTASAVGNTEDEVIERAVSEIVGTMDQVPWVGKIAAISGDKYYLNAGSGDNVKVGDRFEIFALGKVIQDPDSKETIGYEELPAGKAVVSAVGERIATLRLKEQSRSIKVGDKAHPAKE